MKMNGKTVLITGSTDGVGRYVAAKLAAAGAKVLIHGRDTERAQSLIAEIRAQGHGEPIFYQADLSSLDGARALADAVLAGHKRLDVFISNAGIGSRTQGAERRTSADSGRKPASIMCRFPSRIARRSRPIISPAMTAPSIGKSPWRRTW